MFIVYKIPFQVGLLYLIIQNFYIALKASFILLLFGIFLHPIIAIFFYLFFINENSLYSLTLYAKELTEKFTGLKQILAKFLYGLSYFLYIIVPMDTPYSKEYGEVLRSWLVPAKGWYHLFITTIYMILLFSLLFSLSNILLKRREIY